MKYIKSLIILLWVASALHAQSFYVLTGVNDYDPLVEATPELEIYKEEIYNEMREMSKEIKVNTAGHPSRVLAFIISKFSVGDTMAYKIDLELGEYMKRDGKEEGIFAISYIDTRMFKADEDIEDTLMDRVDDMLLRFSHQYKDDNKDMSYSKVGLTHENFAEHMGYETDYNVALAKAKKEHKDLFIFMTMSYCPWCRKMENRMLSKVDINNKIKDHYIPVMLNFSKKNFPKPLREIAMTPTLYVVDSQTEKITHQFVGYNQRGEFLELLKSKK